VTRIGHLTTDCSMSQEAKSDAADDGVPYGPEFP